MLSVNKVIIAGNLTRNPEVKNYDGNKSKTVLTIAVNKSYKTSSGELRKDTYYFRASAWNTLGVNCAKYLAKGSPVLVQGALENYSYQNSDGVKKYMTQINCDQVTFLSSRKSRQNDDVSEPEEVVFDSDSFAGDAVDAVAADIPF